MSGDNKRAKARNSPLASSHLCCTIGLNHIAPLLHRKSYVAGIQNLNRNPRCIQASTRYSAFV